MGLRGLQGNTGPPGDPATYSFTVAAANSAAGPINSSVTINDGDSLRIWSAGGLDVDVVSGSALFNIEPNNMLYGNGSPVNNPADTTRPAIYLDSITGSLWAWDPVILGGSWGQKSIGETGPISGGADFAEYFESVDGEEIPMGTSVVLINEDEDKNNAGKIRRARESELPIGVISSVPGFVGNNQEKEWQGKWEKDIWGQNILNENGQRILSENYNIELYEYIPRSKRPEWNIVGLLGQLRVRIGEIIHPNWIKIRTLSPSVELWLVK
jgi:hypothetical protein